MQNRYLFDLFGTPFHTFIYLGVRRDKKQRNNLLIEICPYIHTNTYHMSRASWQIYPEDTWEACKTSFVKGDMVHSAK